MERTCRAESDGFSTPARVTPLGSGVFSRRGRQLVVQHTLKEREQAVRALGSTNRELETALSDEAARRDQIASDLEERRQSGRACLDLAAGELELRAEDGSVVTARFANSTRKSEPSPAGSRPCRHVQSGAEAGVSGLPPVPQPGRRRCRARRAACLLCLRLLMILRALRGGGWRDSAGILTRPGIWPGRLRDATSSRGAVCSMRTTISAAIPTLRLPDRSADSLCVVGAFEAGSRILCSISTVYLAEYPDVARAGLEP